MLQVHQGTKINFVIYVSSFLSVLFTDDLKCLYCRCTVGVKWVNEWAWRNSWKIMMGKTKAIRKKRTCSRVLSATTNPAGTGQGLNPYLGGKMSAINHRSHDTSRTSSYIILYRVYFSSLPVSACPTFLLTIRQHCAVRRLSVRFESQWRQLNNYRSDNSL